MLDPLNQEKTRPKKYISFSKALRERPQSDLTKMVFFWDAYGAGEYSRAEFNPGLVEDRINLYQVEQVFHNLKESKYFLPQSEKLQWYFVAATSVAPILIFLFVILNLKNLTQSVGATIIFVVVSICLILLSFVAMWWVWQKMKEYQFKRAEDFSECLENLNNDVFRALGLSWSLGTSGAWVQLNLDFVTQENAEEIFAAGASIDGQNSSFSQPEDAKSVEMATSLEGDELSMLTHD